LLELSSYQLELSFSITYDIAVLVNISPDHLDRHGGMDGYIAAKRNIFRRQTRPRTAVVGVDDPESRKMRDALVAADDQNVIAVSSGRKLDRGVYVVDGILHDAIHGDAVKAVDLRPVMTLPGAHNWQNAAAAYATARAVGLSPNKIAGGIATYPGLPHRQERVAEVGGVLFVNDSKATNADAAAKALSCYDAIYWIAGGRLKQGGIAGLTEYFSRLRRVYLIGEATSEFARTLDGKAEFVKCGDLATAAAKAYADARADAAPGAVVLLSPACASFDQFADFEARGAMFRRLVQSIAAADESPAKRAGGAA